MMRMVIHLMKKDKKSEKATKINFIVLYLHRLEHVLKRLFFYIKLTQIGLKYARFLLYFRTFLTPYIRIAHFLGDNHEQNYYTRVLKLILQVIHAKRITFHGFSHTHASYLIKNGVDIAYVSERLRHNNVSITEKNYFHLLKDKRESEDEKTLNLFIS